MFSVEYNQWVDLNTNNIQTHTQTGLSLTVGHMYITRIAAVNGAGLQSTYDTDGIIIDNTPPQVFDIACTCMIFLQKMSSVFVLSVHICGHNREVFSHQFSSKCGLCILMYISVNILDKFRYDFVLIYGYQL